MYMPLVNVNDFTQGLGLAIVVRGLFLCGVIKCRNSIVPTWETPPLTQMCEKYFTLSRNGNNVSMKKVFCGVQARLYLWIGKKASYWTMLRTNGFKQPKHQTLQLKWLLQSLIGVDMNKNRTFFYALFACALIVTGCAGPVTKRSDVSSQLVENERQIQRDLAFNQWVDANQRLSRIGFPIARDNVELCAEDVKQSIGAIITNKYFSGNAEIENLLARNLGLGEELEVVSVVPGSPADAAGLLPGDVIKSINGNAAPRGRMAPEQYSALLPEFLDDESNSTFTIARAGEQLDIEVEPTPICAPTMLVLMDSGSAPPNAFTDGESIFFNMSMMDFASDCELAIVLGHELAHYTMDHIDKKQLNAVGGLIVDILFAGLGINTQGAATELASGAYSQEFESEADYVGLYMTYRAGYPIEDAELFWRKMGVKLGNIDNTGGSHPSSPERFIALGSTKQEIFSKEAKGLPLVPNIEN